jgi:ATP/maltotriose-dependent transcriptional regulator MalT
MTKERNTSFPRDWPGIRLSWLLIRQGRYAEAEALLGETRDLSEHFDFRIITARADILIAELAYRTGDRERARRALDRVFAWASTGYDEEMLIASYLVWAWLALANEDVMSAERYIRVGLREAHEYGYSVYWIDLKIVQGHVAMARHAPERAEKYATLALEGQRQRYGRPELFGAKVSGYLWGEADAIALWAETYSLRGNDKKANELKLEAANIRNRLSS